MSYHRSVNHGNSQRFEVDSNGMHPCSCGDVETQEFCFLWKETTVQWIKFPKKNFDACFILISPLLLDIGTGGQKIFQNTTEHYGGRGGGVMAKSEHYVVYEGSLRGVKG